MDRWYRSVTGDGEWLRSLERIPAHEEKRLVVLRYLAEPLFTPGERYDEREVNRRLAGAHEDVASLRRYLVGAHHGARVGPVLADLAGDVAAVTA